MRYNISQGYYNFMRVCSGVKINKVKNKITKDLEIKKDWVFKKML